VLQDDLDSRAPALVRCDFGQYEPRPGHRSRVPVSPRPTVPLHGPPSPPPPQLRQVLISRCRQPSKSYRSYLDGGFHPRDGAPKRGIFGLPQPVTRLPDGRGPRGVEGRQSITCVVAMTQTPNRSRRARAGRRCQSPFIVSGSVRRREVPRWAGKRPSRAPPRGG
jgi:hypothetical protein